jgi:hypothetical protein
MLLNGIMLLALLATDLLIRNITGGIKDLPYVFLMSTVGAFAYGISFLFLPIPGLAAESLRWRRAMKLA